MINVQSLKRDRISGYQKKVLPIRVEDIDIDTGVVGSDVIVDLAENFDSKNVNLCELSLAVVSAL